MSVFLKKLIKAIKSNKRILIATHIDPDCDGICSALAMAYLVNFYKGVKPTLFCHSSIPKKYNFLLKDYCFSNILKSFDLLIAVDSAGIERIFPKEKYNLKSLNEKFVINIDHHKSNVEFGDIAIIDEKASSACEIIYRIFKELNIKIDRYLATIFYAGIYNETGSFTHPNTTAEALRICSELITKGIKPADLVKKLNAKTVAGTKLLSAVLSTIQIKKNVGIMYLTRKMLKGSQAHMSESENFISFLQAINSVRVSVFFREEQDGVRVSLRSDGLIDVNELAQLFGGGGHRLAAGIKLKEKLPVVEKKILTALFNKIKYANNIR